MRRGGLVLVGTTMFGAASTMPGSQVPPDVSVDPKVLVIESGGAARTIAGRLTEVFVRQDERWLHTGWHLDSVEAS